MVSYEPNSPQAAPEHTNQTESVPVTQELEFFQQATLADDLSIWHGALLYETVTPWNWSRLGMQTPAPLQPKWELAARDLLHAAQIIDAHGNTTTPWLGSNSIPNTLCVHTMLGELKHWFGTPWTFAGLKWDDLLDMNECILMVTTKSQSTALRCVNNPERDGKLQWVSVSCLLEALSKHSNGASDLTSQCIMSPPAGPCHLTYDVGGPGIGGPDISLHAETCSHADTVLYVQTAPHSDKYVWVRQHTITNVGIQWLCTLLSEHEASGSPNMLQILLVTDKYGGYSMFKGGRYRPFS